MKGEGIPRPAAADGYSPADLARRDREMAALAADPRTAGTANRPAYLVDRVLRDAGLR